MYIWDLKTLSFSSVYNYWAAHYPPGNHHASHFKNILFPGHNHLLTTGTDDPSLWLSPERQWVKGHQYRWLAGGYDL